WEHRDRNRLVLAAADRLQHLRAAKRRHIAAPLQLEAGVVDAARGIDGEEEMKVDRDLGVRGPAAAEPHQPGERDERDCAAAGARYRSNTLANTSSSQAKVHRRPPGGRPKGGHCRAAP